jgi:hypothetical protein
MARFNLRIQFLGLQGIQMHHIAYVQTENPFIAVYDA